MAYRTGDDRGNPTEFALYCPDANDPSFFLLSTNWLRKVDRANPNGFIDLSNWAGPNLRVGTGWVSVYHHPNESLAVAPDEGQEGVSVLPTESGGLVFTMMINHAGDPACPSQ